MRSATSPMRDEPGGHDRVGAERAARRVDVECRRRGRAPRARMSSSWLNCACSSATSNATVADARPPRPRAGRRRRCVRSRTPSACASMRCSMPRIHAGRSQSLAGDVVGRDHHRARAVGHREACRLSRSGSCAPARRAASSASRRRLRTACGFDRPLRCGAGRDLGEVALGVIRPRRGSARACSAARSIIDGHSGVTVYGSRLHRHDLGDVAEADDFDEAVDQRRVDLAGLDRDPRLVERPRARPSRRGSPGSAATRRRASRPCTNVNGPPNR